MKNRMTLRLFAGGLLLTLAWTGSARAGTTINAVNKYAYGANLGWLNAYADGVNGAVVTDYTLSGFIYAANVGWINLGSGAPANGIRYQNLSAGDFGVNNDGLGNLRGYAWGANIGWLNFENTGAPAINIKNGRFSGYVWSANCGWISLSNAVAYVQTDHILPGPLDVNGLPIPWELANFGATGINPNGDPDLDGRSNQQEYLAGTDPNNGAEYLHITGQTFGVGGTTATITWASVLTRCYYVQETTSLTPSIIWSDSGLGIIAPDLGTSTVRSFVNGSAPIRFYRVEAVRTLP
jgi:hypothetical protein